MLRMIDKIRRRAVLSSVAVLLFAGVASGISGCTSAMEQKAMEENPLNFTLVAVSSAPLVGEVKPLLIISGYGTFGSDWVDGGGGYTYADLATDVPKTVLSTGTWTATKRHEPYCDRVPCQRNSLTRSQKRSARSGW